MAIAEQRKRLERSHYQEGRDVGEFKLPGSGLKCDKCGGELPNVAHTRKTVGMIIRERRCVKCGELNKTLERVISGYGRGTFSGPCE
jgi:hypothetical protein